MRVLTMLARIAVPGTIRLPAGAFLLPLLLVLAGCPPEPVPEDELDRTIREMQDGGLPGTDTPRKLEQTGKPAVVPLLKALERKDAGDQEGVIEALGRIKDKRAVEPLLKALATMDAKYKGAILEALGSIGDDRAFEPLLKALEDPDRSVRVSAVKGLGKLGDPRAVEPILDQLEDQPNYPNSSIAIALYRLTGEYFPRDPEAARDHWREVEAKRVKAKKKERPEGAKDGQQ
jgi:hypothetical protein